MSLQGLYQDFVRVWHRTETIPESGRGVPITTWAIVVEPGAEPNAAVQRRSGIVRDVGAGDISEGAWMVYMDPENEAGDRDVIEYVDGPQANMLDVLLFVDEPYTPRGHHHQLACRRYLGERPVLSYS